MEHVAPAGGRRRVAAGIVAAGVLVVAAGFGAGVGPLLTSRAAAPHRLGGGGAPAHPKVKLPRAPQLHLGRPSSPPGGLSLPLEVIGWVVLGIVAAAAAGALLRWWWLNGRGAQRSGTAVAADPLAPPPPPGAPDVAPALAALDDESDPRRAVIACWVRLEEAVAATGAARRPAETSGELTRRVLGSHTVDGVALGRLHGLYVEARFAPLPVGPEARDEARRILRGVRTQIETAAEAAPVAS